MAESCAIFQMVGEPNVYRTREETIELPGDVVVQQKVCWDGWADLVMKLVGFTRTHSCQGCSLLVKSSGREMAEKWPKAERTQTAEKWPKPDREEPTRKPTATPTTTPTTPSRRVYPHGHEDFIMGPGRCF